MLEMKTGSIQTAIPEIRQCTVVRCIIFWTLIWRVSAGKTLFLQWNYKEGVKFPYTYRRLPEVHLSPPNLVSLQNAWVPLGQFSANCSLFFAFSVTPMCKISCFLWDGVHNKLSCAQLSTWSKNISDQFVAFEN